MAKRTGVCGDSLFTSDQLSVHEGLEKSRAVLDEIVAKQPTLRDHFAIAALTGLVSTGTTKSDHDSLSRQAYEIADAMLSARGK